MTDTAANGTNDTGDQPRRASSGGNADGQPRRASSGGDAGGQAQRVSSGGGADGQPRRASVVDLMLAVLKREYLIFVRYPADAVGGVVVSLLFFALLVYGGGGAPRPAPGRLLRGARARPPLRGPSVGGG
mgnify:CR=1 FL=1